MHGGWRALGCPVVPRGLQLGVNLMKWLNVISKVLGNLLILCTLIHCWFSS